MPRRKKSDEGIMDITRMAEDLGVSKTTVSRALSGNGRVSEATRQRVVDYAREKNYVPNMMAKSLVTKKSYNVALVFSRQFSNFEGQFLRKTITAVCDVMARNDYDVLLAMVGEQEAQPMQRLLVNHKIDGVILARSLERDPLIPLLQQSKLPFIAIGRPADPTVLYVDHDQVGGCREMTNLLLMKGLHRIALLGIRPVSRASARRTSTAVVRSMKPYFFWSWRPTICASMPSNRLWHARRTACCAWTTTWPCWH